MPSKKDFNAVADILRRAEAYDSSRPDYTCGAVETRAYVAHALADLYQRQNPRFDRARFLAACGVNAKG